jgi:hypothetical protein
VARQKCKLRRTVGEAFQRREAVGRGKLPDRVHAGVKVEWRKAAARIAHFGDAQAHLVPDVRERITGHICLLSKAGSPKLVKRPLRPGDGSG